MADPEQDQTPERKPKIKLSPPGGTGEAPEDTARIDLGAAKTNLDAAKTDLDAARVDLAEGPKEDTTRIDLPRRPPKTQPKSETARVDLAQAKPPAAEDTDRIELPGKKSETARIRLDQARPPRPVAAQAETLRIEVGDEGEAPAAAEAEQRRERDRILSQTTARVDLEDGGAGEETAPATPAERPVVRSQTARVSLEEAHPPGAKAEPATPAPATPPAPALETSPGDTPAAGGAQAEKSKTARIEVPAELAGPAAGRPKTIRIKRADSTAGGPQAAIPEPVIKKTTKGKKKGRKGAADAAEVGTLYSVLALLSLVVIGAVVYVLLAQTFVPSLPWLGKVSF